MSARLRLPVDMPLPAIVDGTVFNMTIASRWRSILGCLIVIVAMLALTGCDRGAAPVSSLRVANQGLLSAALSPDGQYQLVGSFNHGGSLWRLDLGERLYDWNHASQEFSAIQAAAFSADGRFAVTAAGASLTLWSTATGESLRYWQSPTRITSVSISEDARFALLGQENNLAVMFNLDAGGVVGGLRHDDTVSDASMDAGASIATTGAANGKVRVWSLETGAVLQEWTLAGPVTLTEVAASGRVGFVAAAQAEAGIWDLQTGEQVHSLYRVNPGITAAAFKQDESQLLVGTARERVELWDLASGEIIGRWQLPNDGPWHKAAAIALAFRPGDGKYVAAASNGLTYILE